MTRLIFFDASALAKRYASERGSDVINWLFDATADYQKLCALLGAAEIVSVLARKRNRGDLSTIEFAYAFNALFMETFQNPNFQLISPLDEGIVTSTQLIIKHNINSADAIALYIALQIDASSSANEHLFFVSADKRLVRAAKDEGLFVINPEQSSVPEISKLLNG